jgi:hypothetical protein
MANAPENPGEDDPPADQPAAPGAREAAPPAGEDVAPAPDDRAERLRAQYREVISHAPPLGPVRPAADAPEDSPEDSNEPT